MVRFETICAVLNTVAAHDLDLTQFDIRTAFLNGDLEEEIYVVQPLGFVDHEHPEHVCQLRKSLYGLKQFSRNWNKAFHSCSL